MPEVETGESHIHYDKDKPEEPDAIPIGLATQEVVDLFEQFATALTAGDGEKVAELWDVPAFILGDKMEMVVEDLDEISEYMGKGKGHYNQRGIIDTRGDIVHLHWIGEKIALVEVRWPYLNEGGEEIGAETSTYTLRRDDDGNLKVRIAVMHGVETEAH